MALTRIKRAFISELLYPEFFLTGVKMRALLFSFILCFGITSFAGDELEIEYFCADALDTAQSLCIIYDDYDQEDFYDLDCFSEAMNDYGYSMDDLVLENPKFELRPFYNEYVCIEDLPDYD